ncbi:hypothetical protein [Cellulosilyticum lentocellum]|uniref:Uncharacterized protein n=1 Tax=Cellulosilyticum lentocellum (strain ATCC 49066 / DSM 5427 / NCIMB 11756 / RHM5) TaxID=642492 RepID=F2JPJ7_CELLD|nr:hypothetical protein [Cellulosilyticum lentocellum]ADZ82545.1 hypothetical protein Clole_0812 [Cellulosilyticum lentocellum DSM 5427]
MTKKIEGKYDKRYHNTKLLLRNYHEFKQHCIECGNSIEEIDDTLEAWELTLVKEEHSEDYIKSAKRTKARTQIIVDLIDKFLEAHRQEAMNRHDVNKLKRANIIDKMYISDNLTMEKLAEDMDCDIATISRQHKTAINELSVLFFGIEGLKLEA